jgi:peptidoglycan/xylan/chitin deacetylase (PgdA/CDA1 family)
MSRLLARLRRQLWPRRAQPLILMYHRVAAPAVDPWALSVSPDRFAAQLEVLRTSRTVLALPDFVARARRGALPADAVAITFDDGYADTRHAALPRLAAAGLPATVFVATAFVGQPVEYWWDELARALLGPESAAWRASDPPRTDREARYYATWRRLRELAASERDDEMARLREAERLAAAAPADLPMSEADLAALVRDGLVDVGGHTVTHPVLPALAPAARRREILEGKRACERLTDRPAVGFAYPYGANDADSRAAAAECGFAWACTTEARPVSADGVDPFALPRIAVGDWDAAAFDRALWMACA